MKKTLMVCLLLLGMQPMQGQAFSYDFGYYGAGSWNLGWLFEPIDEIIVTAPRLEYQDVLWQLNELGRLAPHLFDSSVIPDMTPESIVEAPPRETAPQTEECALLVNQWKEQCQAQYRALGPYCTGGLFVVIRTLVTLPPAFRVAWEMVPADALVTMIAAGQCSKFTQAIEERCERVAADPTRGPRLAGCEQSG
jgi:hypothetical protein